MTARLIPDNPANLLITVGAAADVLGVTLRSVQLWCNSGLLACVVTPGGHRRIRQSEVQRLADSMAFKPAADALAVSRESQQIATLESKLASARAALKLIATDTRFVPNYHGQHEFSTNTASIALAAIR